MFVKLYVMNFQNRVTCQMTGNSDALNYFSVDTDTCYVRVAASLLNDFSNTVQYTVSSWNDLYFDNFNISS